MAYEFDFTKPMPDGLPVDKQIEWAQLKVRWLLENGQIVPPEQPKAMFPVRIKRFIIDGPETIEIDTRDRVFPNAWLPDGRMSYIVGIGTGADGETTSVYYQTGRVR